MIWLALLFLVAWVGLLAWRQIDHHADRAEMDRLLSLQPKSPVLFSSELLVGLPEPARRYFAFAIAEGTPLFTVAEIEMVGRFSLGSKDTPNYMDMTAKQVLAAPVGFVWKMSGGAFPMRMSGSDSASWTRFWMAGLAPVARFGGNPDHRRSAFGRYIAEAAFWTPAALLPGPNVSWKAQSDSKARVTVQHDELVQAVDITVDADGRATRVDFQRWTNANSENAFRTQQFGGYLSGFKEFKGFHLPTHIEAGNNFGTEDYFPFYIADVTDIRFP